MTVRLLVETDDDANLQELERMLKHAGFRTQRYPSEPQLAPRHHQQTDVAANGFERPVLATRSGVQVNGHAQRDHSERSKLIAVTRNLYATLTPRQQTVLRQMLTGRPNKIIADDLSITEKTVKAHRSQVMLKMQTGSIAELARRCTWADIEPATF